jgi:hypothetical protein
MINLPAFSGATFVALIMADLIILGLAFVGSGSIFISGNDLLGRPLPEVSIFRRGMLVLLVLFVAAFLAVQVVIFYRFMPYYLDPGAIIDERVVSTSVANDAHGVHVAYWVTTEKHRFGVTEDIFRNIGAGDIVHARFRALDDTLYEISVVQSFNGNGPLPSASPKTPAASSAASPKPKH